MGKQTRSLSSQWHTPPQYLRGGLGPFLRLRHEVPGSVSCPRLWTNRRQDSTAERLGRTGMRLEKQEFPPRVGVVFCPGVGADRDKFTGFGQYEQAEFDGAAHEDGVGAGQGRVLVVAA